ncbi:hypothetical protein Tco_0825094 [Tanacetum coccineum]
MDFIEVSLSEAAFHHEAFLFPILIPDLDLVDCSFSSMGRFRVPNRSGRLMARLATLNARPDEIYDS